MLDWKIMLIEMIAAEDQSLRLLATPRIEYSSIRMVLKEESRGQGISTRRRCLILTPKHHAYHRVALAVPGDVITTSESPLNRDQPDHSALVLDDSETSTFLEKNVRIEGLQAKI